MNSVKVDINGETYNMAIATNQYSIGLISDKCPLTLCDVPKRYQSSKSQTYTEVSKDPWNIFRDHYEMTTFKMRKTNLYGVEASENMSLRLREYGR
jgi:hypothetical protein